MSWLFLSYALAHLALGLWGSLSARRRPSSYVWLMLAVVFALVYDNAIIGLGHFIGAGPLLQTLNAGRFVLHGLLTPLLIIYGFGLLRQQGVGWAQRPWPHAIFCGFATALIVWGAYADIVRLQLEFVPAADVTRYTNIGGPKGPPLGALGAILTLIPIGLWLWRKQRWPWLFVGSLAMLIVAGVGARSLALSNFGEVALTSSLVATEVLAPRPTHN